MFENLKNFSAKEAEEEVLKFWQENKIFEKSLKKSALKGDYVFYDGPPFATGLPHYGHILASTMKDVVPRYWTMKGYKVERKWGWDCHGLPIENIAEKELGIKRKKEIEEMGVVKFNEFCRSKVLDYVADWKKVIAKLGRWADMENSYKTMDWSFMESVWWVFKELWDKGLIYEGYRSMHICTRCETTLSQQEVAEGYKVIKDLAATAKFHLKPGQKYGNGYETKDKVFVLAWTTTPWTLIGNVALAVGNDIAYTALRVEGVKELIILASDRVKEVFKDKNIEIIHDDIKGEDIVGLEYDPLFDYYVGKGIQNEENGWKIYGADFVTTEEGTGVVHIAPAFGDDDFKLMEKYKLPFVQHVGMDGVIKEEAKDFAGLQVKPMEDHQKTDVEVIKYLAKNDLLFTKEKYEHSYPHCWRCETPLINYATSSWFVNVLKVKERALELAKNINWVPTHIKEGRFGNWLEGARDWSISRQRYWASVIPIWKCKKCGEAEAVGAIDELKSKIKKSGNKYFVMRHGEADSNAKSYVSTDIKKDNSHLTEKGKGDVLETAKNLSKQLNGGNIDFIFSSPFFRTKETAEIVAGENGFKTSEIIFDERLREIGAGDFEGKSWGDYRQYFSNDEERFNKVPPQGESLREVKNRITEFIYDIDKKYLGKNILIVSHECPIWLLMAGVCGADMKSTLEMGGTEGAFIATGEIRELNFVALPRNDNYELDLHKPYIDEVELECSKCGEMMKRIPDVLDTWFDSGSMPYAQMHYPFENREKFDKNFPAEFIAEGVDQTRAWFYYLHILATALKDSHSFKNVIVNGIVLAEDGKKMSKRLSNYPDPMEVILKYGADALRLYMLSSPVVKAESLNFSEKGVDEIYKKNIARLWNVLSFYKLYTINQRPTTSDQRQSENILDKWILARLKQLKADVTGAMDEYELDKATRPFEGFIDDLSNWYIRRSRSRFTARGIVQNERRETQKELEEDRINAVETTRYVLMETAKLLAPFTPFIAEGIYQQLTINDKQPKRESVHLEEWPKIVIGGKGQETSLIQDMQEVRNLASISLEARAKVGVKVRQPLNKMKVKSEKLKEQKELLEILADEINVKQVVFDDKIQGDVELDIEITEELKNEGVLREITRGVQDLRKKAGLQPENRIELFIETSEEIRLILENNKNDFQKGVGADSLEFKKGDVDLSEEIKIDSEKIWLGVRKV